MKTPPILLKLLHNSAAKPSPNFHKIASRKGDQGFTLLEVLVIALIVGILSSIAAPGWLAFINRQRVRTVNDRVFQSLRLAQSEAKRTKSDRVVTLNPLVDPPTATIKTDPAQNPPLQTVNFDAGGEIKPKQVKLSVASCPPNSACTAATQLTFNYNGVVDANNSNNPKLPFVVTVAPAGGGTKQCVIVETLLGGMRTAEGEYNSSTKEGCPVIP
ncbi:prepilin-type N-terminal cleavage/methylation domain-containing protein [Microcoleus sp. MON1_C5]|uniref:prepilin-type N-terminal cleavage/methylation domain-containing protein n=1 Tax=Microcoleus sp. MON1_C5 TaxID=2818828 RepID=UPI002FD6E91F